jgi:hypothetical protein
MLYYSIVVALLTLLNQGNLIHVTISNGPYILEIKMLVLRLGKPPSCFTKYLHFKFCKPPLFVHYNNR